MTPEQERLRNFIEGYGIANAGQVIEAHAASSNRPVLSQCLALLENETAGEFDGHDYAGGLNIYGHEGPLPQLYGQPVTEANYQQYKAARDRGKGVNGVGPCQITDASLQIQAQELGGCWIARCSMDVGFFFLHALMVEYGTAEGFRHYNGAGPAAFAYRDRAVANAAKWHQRLVEHGMPAK